MHMLNTSKIEITIILSEYKAKVKENFCFS